MASLFERLKRQFDTNDGGATFSNPTPRKQAPAVTPAPTQNRAAVAPARPVVRQAPRVTPKITDNTPGFQLSNNSLTRGLSRAFDQTNPFDNGRTWKQRTPVKTGSVVQQATHNGLTNVVGDAVVKPAVRLGVGVNQGIANAEIGIAHSLGLRKDLKTQNAQQFTKNSYGNLGGFNKAIDYKGTKRQILGDTISTVSNVAAPGSSKLVEQGVVKAGQKVTPKVVQNITPQVVKRVAPKVVGNAAVGAPVGAATNVGSLISSDAPLTKQSLADAAKTGAVFGAAGGAALPIAGVGLKAAAPAIVKGATKTGKAVAAGAQKTAVAAEKVNQKAFTPRASLEDQLTLKDYSDYLAGAYKPKPRELTPLLQKVRDIGDKHGVNLKSGTVADLHGRTNAILDQIGTKNRNTSEGGYIRAGGRDASPSNVAGTVPAQTASMPSIGQASPASLPTSVAPNAEARVFAQNPMTTSQPDFAGRGISPLKSPIQKSTPQAPQQVARRELQTSFQQGNLSSPANPHAVSNASQLPGVSQPPALLDVRPASRYKTSTQIGQEGQVDKRLELSSQSPSTQHTPKSVKIYSRGGEKTIPISRVESSGRVVSKTNLSTGAEKRFSIDANGELMPDTKGAYRIFTDEDGRVKQFRIGDEVYDAKNLGDLSTVNGYGSVFATMRRNIERSFDKPTGDKVNDFLVNFQQGQATKQITRQVQLQKDLKQVADELGISFGVGRGKAKKVSAAIQDFGEGRITKADLDKQFGSEYAGKIVAADKWFRHQYDSLLDEMNQTLTKYGYDPVPKRKDYYTHFENPSLWSKFGLKMQEIKNQLNPTMQDALPDNGRGKISNKLAGESEYMQPNKAFNPFALKRTGDTHTADAFGAFERYMNPTLNNIYMTPAITRARVIAKAVAQDADSVSKDANKTVIQLKEWANNLAGKSSRFGDRQLADTMHGQKFLKGLNFLQRRAGANTIVGNLATAVLQPVMLTQTMGKFGAKNFLLAAMQEGSTAHAAGAAIRQSAFMRRRYSNMLPVTAGKLDRAANVANKPLEVVEETATRVTWNAAHNDALSKGLTGKAAIKYADQETEKTVAGRSIGERPEIFNSKTAGPFTMYQLEVNNFWQQMGKEMTKTQAAKTLAALYVFNLGLKQVTGGQVGFNPVQAVIDSYHTATSDESVGDKAKAIGQRFAGEVVDNTPIIGPLANATIGDKNLRGLLGPTSNVGRFGASSPISTLISNPGYLVSPFGGNQIKKTYQGIKTLANGGLQDKNGEQTVATSSTAPNIARGVLFGKNAIPEVNAYNTSIGQKNPLTKDQQEQLRDLPADQQAAFKKEAIAFNKAMSEAKGDKAKAKTTGDTSKLNAVDALAVKKEQQNQLLKNSLSAEDYKISRLSEKEQKKLVAQGAYTQAKIDGLNNYVKNKKKELGFDVPDELDSKLADSLNTYGIKDSYIKFKQRKDNISDDDLDSWRQKEISSDDQKLYDKADAIVPEDMERLPKTNRTLELFSKFTSDYADAKTELKRSDLRKEFVKDAYQSTLSDNATALFSSDYSMAQKLAAVQSGDISMEDAQAAADLDNYLVAHGLSSQVSISKKLRSALGLSAPVSSSSGSGSGGGGGSSRSRKVKLADYNMADIYKLTSGNERKLRQLLGLTRLS